jgi:hypothetical protein
VTDEMLGHLPGVLRKRVSAGFFWMTRVAQTMHRDTRALAAPLYQESGTARATLGRLDR